MPTTAPLDDFTYAMRVADAWKPGRKGEDTGVVFLVAVKDRKLRILTGYGLEGILPDGLVGEIEDREIVPAFRAGQVDEGIRRGVVALAARIAESRGIELHGAPPPPPAAAPLPPSIGVALLVLVLIFLGVMLVYGGGPPMVYGRRGFGGFGGGFGGGGGGFGGFGGGGFGGGGAGRSW